MREKFKTIYYFLAIVCLMLFVYHFIRFYIVEPGCGYIKGGLNQGIEFSLAIVSLFVSLLCIIEIIYSIVKKNKKGILFNSIGLIIVIGLFCWFLNNIVLECWKINLDPIMFNINRC